MQHILLCLRKIMDHGKIDYVTLCDKLFSKELAFLHGKPLSTTFTSKYWQQ